MSTKSFNFKNKTNARNLHNTITDNVCNVFKKMETGKLVSFLLTFQKPFMNYIHKWCFCSRLLKQTYTKLWYSSNNEYWYMFNWKTTWLNYEYFGYSINLLIAHQRKNKNYKLFWTLICSEYVGNLFLS